MRFRLLGSLEVLDGTGWVPIRSAKCRSLLAVLLIRAGEVLPLAYLIRQLWGDEPPKSAPTQVHGYVLRLRRMLNDRDGRLLVTRAPGYRLAVGERDVDRQLFDNHVDDGQEALRRKEFQRAAEQLGAALALWRGAPLSDVDATELVVAECDRLVRQRLSAWEARIDAELALGRHAELIGEVRRHVEAHPLRERPWQQLMLALYRDGRQAEALQAYQRVRRTFLDELGVEPSAETRNLHQRLLTGEPDAPAPAATFGPAPRQLPAAPRFVGRTAELGRLDTLLGVAGAMATITGPAGIGKTALAVHWAHLVSDRFPDGQLYANLRGYDANPPAEPGEVLGRFLPALGVAPADVPPDTGRRAALYRELLAGRRVLVLLDNAGGMDQVRALLPGSPTCVAVITSRDEPHGPAGTSLRLGALHRDDAIALLVSVLGSERAGAETAMLAELARLCGHLPLALRIAGAKLVARPQQTLAGHIADLREGNRLTELSVEGDPHAGVRAAFDLSYAALSAPARRLFDRLGLLPGPDFTVPAAAALAGTGLPTAGALLTEFAAAHVIEPSTSDRFVLHDLLRIYAREHAAGESPVRRDDALRRLLDFYLANATAAAGLLNPGLAVVPPGVEEPPVEMATVDSDDAALSWLDAERSNLAAAITDAARGSLRRYAWRLCYALRPYFLNRRVGEEWVALAHIGLNAAEADGDETGQAAMHLSLGHAYWCVGDYQSAIDHYGSARAGSRRIGWRLGESGALNGLAITAGQLGRLEQAIEHLTEALSIDRALGARDTEGRRLNNLGYALQELGRLEEAADHYRQALAVRRQLRDRSGECLVLAHLGRLHRQLGQLDAAIELLDEALRIATEIGSHYAQALIRRNIAEVHHDAGRYDLARTTAEQALPQASDRVDHEVHVGLLNTLGLVQTGLGELTEANRCHTQALRITGTSGYIRGRVEALIGLARLRNRLVQPDAAVALADEARTLARQHGLRLAESEAQAELDSVRRVQIP